MSNQLNNTPLFSKIFAFSSDTQKSVYAVAHYNSFLIVAAQFQTFIWVKSNAFSHLFQISYLTHGRSMWGSRIFVYFADRFCRLQTEIFHTFAAWYFCLSYFLSWKGSYKTEKSPIFVTFPVFQSYRSRCICFEFATGTSSVRFAYLHCSS